jgi:hypothetical protein
VLCQADFSAHSYRDKKTRQNTFEAVRGLWRGQVLHSRNQAAAPSGQLSAPATARRLDPWPDAGKSDVAAGYLRHDVSRARLRECIRRRWWSRPPASRASSYPSRSRDATRPHIGMTGNCPPCRRGSHTDHPVRRGGWRSPSGLRLARITADIACRGIVELSPSVTNASAECGQVRRPAGPVRPTLGRHGEHHHVMGTSPSDYGQVHPTAPYPSGVDVRRPYRMTGNDGSAYRY